MLVATSSCSDVVGPTGEVAAVRFSLEPAPDLLPGQTLKLTPLPLNARGEVLDIVCVRTFSSDNSAVARVDQEGNVTAVAPGIATITATLNNVPQTIQVVVVAGGSLVVVPSTAATGVGGTAQFTAILRDQSNNIVTGRPVAWSSSNNSIATISSSGVATGVAPGTVTVTASSEGRTATATLTVATAGAASITLTPQQSAIGVGAVQLLTATVRDAAGNVLPNRVVTFTSSSPSVAAIAGTTTNTVSVRGASAGTATITATSEGRSATATVNVTSTGSGSLTVTPNPVTLAVGVTVGLTSTVRDPAGNVVAGAAISYSSANPAIASVSPAGVITGHTPGSTTVAVSSGGQTVNVGVTVTTTGAGSITITPANPALSIGQAVQLTGTVRDANGNVLPDRPVTWTSSNPQVATVSGTGVITGVGAGTTTITATSEGRTATTTATVGAATSSSLTLTPSQATIGVNGNVQLTATLRDANGNVITGRPVTFTTSAAGVATVDANGRVTGVAPGTATITATSDGRTATSTITVVAGGVGSVGVTPATATTPVRGTVQLTAVVRDGNGNVLTDRPVTWTSSAPAIATVDANGLVTGTGPGNATITATSEGKSGTSQITVTQAPVATITTTPTTASIPVGGTVQITATVRDGNGNVLTDRPVTWVSSNPAVASVDGTGKVTGVTTGTVTITATSEGKSASSTVTVTTPGPAPVGTVTITPPNPAPCVGQTTQLTAVVRDAAGNILTGRPVTWTSTNTAVATVSATGLLTGLVAGTATIIASVEGQAGTVSVTVCVAAVATLELAPATASVGVNGTVQLVATAKDALGNVLTGKPVTFTTSNAAVATVDASGRVTGVTPGTATITATSEGRTATSVITVTPATPPPAAPVASITITPTNPEVCIGQTTQLTATLRDASGNILTGRDVVFTSNNTAIATVTAGGLLTGVAAGTATITATSEGQSTTVQASICVAAVASIALAPATATVAVGATTRLTATVTDALGNILTGQPVTFTSSNATVATVAADGTVLGLTPGTTTITATSGGRTATSIITVVLP